MQLKISTIQDIRWAIRQLSGANQKTNEPLFKFASRVKRDLVKNLNAMKLVLEPTDEAQKEFELRRLCVCTDPVKVAELEREFRPLLQEVVEIPLISFRYGDFNIDTNNIPETVLSALQPILLEDEEKKA